MTDTLTTVDLAKARAYVQVLTQTDEAVGAGLWIEDLADAVESLQRDLRLARDGEQAAMAQAAEATAENEQLREALREICGGLAQALGGLRT